MKKITLFLLVSIIWIAGRFENPMSYDLLTAQNDLCLTQTEVVEKNILSSL